MKSKLSVFLLIALLACTIAGYAQTNSPAGAPPVGDSDVNTKNAAAEASAGVPTQTDVTATSQPDTQTTAPAADPAAPTLAQADAPPATNAPAPGTPPAA